MGKLLLDDENETDHQAMRSDSQVFAQNLAELNELIKNTQVKKAPKFEHVQGHS